MPAAVHQDVGRHPASIVTCIVNAHYEENDPNTEIQDHLKRTGRGRAPAYLVRQMVRLADGAETFLDDQDTALAA
jgi:hypothetical protein